MAKGLANTVATIVAHSSDAGVAQKGANVNLVECCDCVFLFAGQRLGPQDLLNRPGSSCTVGDAQLGLYGALSGREVTGSICGSLKLEEEV